LYINVRNVINIFGDKVYLKLLINWRKLIMENNLKGNFITLNEVMENIQCLWGNMTEEEKKICVQEFFGIRNKATMELFIQKYIPVKY